MGAAAEKIGGNTNPNTISRPWLEPLKWKPGQSGNPNGRPAGSVGLARYIREHTGDGRDLVDFMLEVIQGECDKYTRTADKIIAVKWLADRGFGAVEIADDNSEKRSIDFSKLTEQELSFLADVHAGFLAIQQRLGSGEAPAQS